MGFLGLSAPSSLASATAASLSLLFLLLLLLEIIQMDRRKEKEINLPVKWTEKSHNILVCMYFKDIYVLCTRGG